MLTTKFTFATRTALGIKMATVEELRKVAQRAQDELWRIEKAERLAVSEKLVGKAFKYRNNYSVPERPSDYWWLYVLVTDVDKSDGQPIVKEFQIDKYGDASFRPKRHLFHHMNGYEPITKREYDAALKKFKAVCAAA